MPGAGRADLGEVWPQWQDAVNMTASGLREWLETDDSQAVGDSGGSGQESTGHRSGRRYSLMNWGHDPLKDDA
jgi:Protein of unknown function (DUF3140)